MADHIYYPSDEDEESETPSPQTELSVESFSDYKDSLATDKTEMSAREAASQHQRRVDPESPEDAHARPIAVHKTKGDGPLSLNEAADNLAYSRGLQLGEDLVESGLSQRQLAEMAEETIARSERLDPKMPPPAEAKVLDRFLEEGEPLSVTEAANQLSDWRIRHVEQQEQELRELVGEAAQERQAEAQFAQQEPSEQPQQQPEMTPAQIERAQLAAERQHITNLKRIEGHEAALRNDYDKLVAAVVQEFPSLQHGPPSPEQIEDLRQKDPQRFQKLAMADQMLRERGQRIAALAQQRGLHEQQRAQIDAQARAAARAKQDQAFEQLAAQHIPNWESRRGEVTTQARKTLNSAGLSDSDINRLWNGDEVVDAHSSVLQLVLAKAALWDSAQEKARQVRQSNLPQLMRPGTHRSSASDSDVSVNELRAQLRRASGREAIRLGTALARAQRMNGG